MARQSYISGQVFLTIFWTFVFLQTFHESLGGGPYVDRVFCMGNTVDACRRLGFGNITTSNIFGLTADQSGIAEEIERLMPLAETGCSRDLLALICGAYLPGCDRETGERLAPCKDTCRKVVNQKCKGQMKRMGFKGDRAFTCRNYPSRREEKQCLTDLSTYREPETTTAITTPVMNTTTTEATPDEPHVPSVIFTVERSASNDGWVLVKGPKPNLSPEVTGFEVIYYNSRGDDGGERTITGEDQIHLNLSSDASYTVLTRAFNLTDVGVFEDALMEPYVHPHCEEISYSTLRSLCSNVNYRFVQYSNRGWLESQAAAAEQIAPAENILRNGGTECTDYLKQFLCTVYAPPCTRMGPGIDPLLPCRELCQRAVDNCEADPSAGIYKDMANINCTTYPSMYDENATCFSNEAEVSLWPLIGGKGHVMKNEGDKVTAFCSASCPNCTRPQWFDPNGMEITANGIENSIREVYSTNVGTFSSKLTIKSLNSSWAGEYICLFNNREKIMSITLFENATISQTTPAEANITSNRSMTANVTITPNGTMIYNATTMHNATMMYNDTMMYNVTMMRNGSMIYNTTMPPSQNVTAQPSQNGTAAPVEGNTTQTSTDATSETNATTTAGPDQNITAINTTTLSVNTTAPSSICSSNGTGDVLARSYVINDRGMTSFFRGWVDVQGQGSANDFCRLVRTDDKPFMACLLAGSMEDNLLTYTSPHPSEEWFDPGYSNTWYMKDEDGDGRDDYCRCIGSVPDTSVICMKAGLAGFEGQEHDFTPETSPMDCFYLTADPYFGFP